MLGKPNIEVVILAAGDSSRFSPGHKALPEPEGAGLLAELLGSLALIGFEKPLVVVGPKFPEVGRLALELGARTTVNREPDRGMFSSVLTGLSCARYRSAVAFLPVDAGLVSPDSILSLVSFWSEFGPQKNSLAVLPAHGGRLGHPPVLGGHLAAWVRAWGGGRGLRGALASLAGAGWERGMVLEGLLPPGGPGRDSALRYLPLDDPMTLCDVDTREDLARFREIREGSLFAPGPTPQKALTLLALCGAPHKLDHSLSVAVGALRLAVALESAGAGAGAAVLAFVGGILHDLDHGKRRHAKFAMRHLTSLGWEEAALVVGEHTSLGNGCRRYLGWPLSPFAREQDGEDGGPEVMAGPVALASLCVHMADKCIKGPRLVDMDTRFDPENHNISSPAGLVKLRLRRADCEALEGWFERLLDRPVRDVIMTPGGHPLEDLVCGVAGTPGLPL
ncbi:MAG: NTP transferase domain-containing protein [Deltaproteobacteria bacterium]|jgi:molybdopterin-guanine dinucleotide biosynthesis protein A|nr:NTP transferase domain-containing protein [Deltaproteobacteria bacterium]